MPVRQTIPDRGWHHGGRFVALDHLNAEGFVAFVRQGDLVAEVKAPDARDRSAARDLAVRAAQRLCATTTTC